MAAGIVLIARSGAAVADSDEAVLQRAISSADRSLSMRELTRMVREAAQCCNQSAVLSAALTAWLRESHPIYADRLPSEAAQFRGFLLAALGAFPPNEELYRYVKGELMFGGHAFAIAAAAVTARSFAERADELLPLMGPFLGSSFDDESLDITTPELNYPIERPTRARHEIIRTLAAFGSRACRYLPLLEAIPACPNCGTYAVDSTLPAEATAAAQSIREASGQRCPEEIPARASSRLVIDPNHRRTLLAGSVKILDQDGEAIELGDLRGRPFVLTFFYSQCANALKCVSTVRRLRDLAAACERDGLADRVGIYGMTYDARLDTPGRLKQYGTMYGMKFSRNVRLLKTADELDPALRHSLGLRVNYGAGSVNQHGVQLFLFDKKGRLAAAYDNERWTVTEVETLLARLTAE